MIASDENGQRKWIDLKMEKKSFFYKGNKGESKRHFFSLNFRLKRLFSVGHWFDGNSQYFIFPMIECINHNNVSQDRKPLRNIC